MKSTGIVRRVDDLGRIVLPKELRTTMKIEEADALEIYVDDDVIILKKYQPGCAICGDIEKDMREFKGKLICSNCREKIGRYYEQSL